MFLELLQIALGNLNQLSRDIYEQEWKDIFVNSVRHAVTGICFAGVEKIPKEQYPPQTQLYQWIGFVEQIRQQNVKLDKQTTAIWKELKNNGVESVVLKGQGIAHEYGSLSQLRQSGDIDLWVKGGYDIVCNYVQQTHPTEDVAYHRFHYDCFENTEVELHHRPTLMRNLFADRKLAKWYDSFGADSFVYLEDKGFAVPPVEFNRIFILTHIYRHFLFEGIGLRQIIDYYFVLKDNGGKDKEEIAKILKELRLLRFAEAMMWILHTQLGLKKRYLICGMNEKEGRFVLSEILKTGNFGQGDSRYKYKRWFKLRHHIAHGTHLLMHYPSEVMWTPIWLVYHKMWKWNKKRNIRKSLK